MEVIEMAGEKFSEYKSTALVWFFFGCAVGTAAWMILSSVIG